MQLSQKKSLLTIWKILGLFVNPLTSDDKYRLLNKGKLKQPIQMQLSKKQRTFYKFFDFLEFRFWKFWRKILAS